MAEYVLPSEYILRNHSLAAETYPSRIERNICAVSHKKLSSAPYAILIEFNKIQFILRISPRK